MNLYPLSDFTIPKKTPPDRRAKNLINEIHDLCHLFLVSISLWARGGRGPGCLIFFLL